MPSLPDGTRVTGSFAEQAHAAFRNLAAVAEAAGSSLDQAVRVGVYLRDFSEFVGGYPPLQQERSQPLVRHSTHARRT